MLRADQQRVKYDIEIPPAATSLTQYFEGDKWLSPLKKLVDGKKTQDKLKWVNSPNSYQRVEIAETGTLDPKKITKWVQDSSPANSNPIKIENPHQFVPVTADPSEFRRKQKEMKQVRMQNKISGGPQSHILEGVTWEEVGRKQGENEVVLVGAASKGIIQREYQHNATVYKSAYAKNPFDNVTNQDLEEYKSEIEKKQHPEEPDTAINGEEKLADISGASRSSKEGSPVKDLSEEKSLSKKDKKKKGIRTPSFLKKRKHKKEKEDKVQV